MAYIRTIILLMIVSIAGLSQAEDVSKTIDWTLWEKVFAAKEKNWKLIKDKKGIKVWSRSVDISPIKSFKGVTEFETSVSALTALMFDTEYLTSWMELTDFAEVIKLVGKTEMYRYTINKPPWPVNPRDACSVLKGYYYPETGAVFMRVQQTPDLLPRNKKYIRIPIIMGYYKIVPKLNGKVEFTFEAIVEMGGWLPKWIINFWLAEVPHGTFRSIQGAMPLDRYKNYKYDFKKDFEVLN